MDYICYNSAIYSVKEFKRIIKIIPSLVSFIFSFFFFFLLKARIGGTKEMVSLATQCHHSGLHYIQTMAI